MNLLKEFYEKEYLVPLVDDGWARKRAKVALRFIPANSKILNLGCGVGFESQEFVLARHEVWGCDVSWNALKHAKQFQENTLQLDLNEVPFPYASESFDVVYASEVVEHLFSIKAFLKECHRILELNGILILTTNNPAYLKNRFRLLFGKSDWTCIKGHLQLYTPSKLKEFLVNAGFKVLFCWNIGNFLFAELGDDYIVVAKKLEEFK